MDGFDKIIIFLCSIIVILFIIIPILISKDEDHNDDTW
jgi:hypothetical protein